MALETFDYPDGTTSIPSVTTYEGGYSVQGGVLTMTADRTRIVWPSQRNGTWTVTIDPASSQNGNAGIIIRGSDVNNYLSFFFRSSDGLVRGGKFVNGSNTEILNTTATGYGFSQPRTLTVEAYGDNIDVFLDGQHKGRYVDDSGLLGSDAGLRTDSTAYTFDDFRLQDPTPVIPNGDPLVPLIYSGKKRQLNKLGQLLTTHSEMLASGATKELHPSLLDMNGVADWPYAKYPFMLATSSDHSSGSGGIYIRVFNSELGGFTTSAAWEEWQDVSNRAEFSHINKKTNPIYADTVAGQQTETPYLKVVDGVVHLFYHNQGVFVSGAGFGQATSLATSTNGIDFSRNAASPVLSYRPRFGMGDFHTGYMSVTESILPDFPYSKIALSAHGGGAPVRGGVSAIWGTEDYINYNIHYYLSRVRGEVIDFNPPTWGSNEDWILIMMWAIHLMKKEGPYYRMIFQIRPDIVVGGDTQHITVCEVLVDKEFNVVSDINYFMPLGLDGEFDDYGIINYHAEVNYLGTTYAIYLANESSSVSSIGIAEVEEVPHDWNVIRPLGGKISIVEEKVSGTTLPNLTYSHAASVQTTEVGEEAVMTIPAGGAVASATSSAVTLSDYNVIDFHLGSIAKNADINIQGRVGFYDDPVNPQNGVGLYWYPDTETGEKKRFLALEVIENGVSRKVQTYRALGQLAADSPNLYESPEARLDVGIRVDAARRKVFVMTGQNENSNDSLYGLDVDTPLIPMLAFSTTEASDEQIYFDDFRVTSYSNELQVDEGVNDTIKPTITVSGSPTTTVQLGDPAPSFIASANDNLDGDLTSSLVVTGDTVPVDGSNNTTTAGTYVIRWNVADSNNNDADEVTRTVIVEAAQQITTPPTVILGSNQSVSSGATVQLDATQSTAGSHPIASYEWTQTAGDTVTLVNSTTASPSFIAPSENEGQTLTFDVVAIDSEGNRSSAKTVSISVAGFTFEGSILELIDSVSFELVTDGNLMIYPGRANREIIKLRPSSVLGLVVDDEDCIDFDNPLNTISKLEVIIYNTTEKAVIDSEGSAIVFEGSEAHCRFGDFQPKSAKEPFDVAVVLYISGDGRGVVVYSTSEALSTQGAASVSAYVQPSLGV